MAGSMLAFSCKKGNPTGPASLAGLLYPVETITVKAQPVTYAVYAVGSVEAFENVQMTARVAGVVEKVLFSEGAQVKAGQVLVEIEPQRYNLAVESAQAAFEKATAARADAEAALKRRETVVRQNPGLITAEELETWRTKVRVAIADGAQAAAALDQAKLNLHDAYVRTPVGGVIQTRTVQTGQYVQPGTVLASLLRRDPLLLHFQVSEQDAAHLQMGLTVYFRLANSDREFTSRIIHVAASADVNNRMVAVTAEVNDPQKNTLQAGAFSEIRVPVGSLRNAAVIPQTAVRPSERGFVSFVVVNEKAEERILKLGMRTADGQVEVLSGLQPGEQLIVRGSEALRNGVTIRLGKGPDATLRPKR
jgi:multidrug efflux system membrane fusion protein